MNLKTITTAYGKVLPCRDPLFRRHPLCSNSFVLLFQYQRPPAKRGQVGQHILYSVHGKADTSTAIK